MLIHLRPGIVELTRRGGCILTLSLGNPPRPRSRPRPRLFLPAFEDEDEKEDEDDELLAATAREQCQDAPL